MIDGDVFEICNFFGGFGFVNAVPWDYDNDGNPDLLIASSWGSGLHRSEISVFNTKTKESIVIYDTSATNDPSVDLIVVTSALALSSADPQNLPKQYLVFSADIEAQNNNLADLSCVKTSIVGTVLVKDGVPEFIPIEQ